MILELGNGREMKLPDDMDDEVARQLGKLILSTEQRAQDAEDRARNLEAQFAQLGAEVKGRDNSDVVRAIATMQASFEAALGRVSEAVARVEKAAAADRHLMLDEYGEHTVSRAHY